MKSRMSLAERRRRVYESVEIGAAGDLLSRAYDLFYTLTIVLNLTATILDTYDALHAKYGSLFALIEFVTVTAFAVDYVLRIYTADFKYRGLSRGKAAAKYAVSFGGVVDILSFLPVYLPFFFPSGAAAFRLVRVIRIFRLFRINAYYDSLNVITSVLSSKKNQLISSVSIILVLMLASSLCMYSLENEAQPEVFSNAFSGIWWAASTLLTVGYGDIYPITPLGKLFGICITFLGVGMVAIPTGIISAGFVEQYTQFALLGDNRRDETLRFVSIELTPGDSWTNKAIRELKLPAGLLIAIVRRGKDSIVPNGDLVLEAGDIVVLGAEPLPGTDDMELKEMVVSSKHKWKDQAIRDLDISRQTFIVMVKRGDKKIVPRGSTVLQEGDCVYMYKKA